MYNTILFSKKIRSTVIIRTVIKKKGAQRLTLYKDLLNRKETMEIQQKIKDIH